MRFPGTSAKANHIAIGLIEAGAVGKSLRSGGYEHRNATAMSNSRSPDPLAAQYAEHILKN
ncbi:hypothetical protein ACVMIH_002385 [Bradyrhizobium sp. USDA 4503]